MTAKDIFLYPGEHALAFTLEILALPAHEFEPALLRFLAALLSWVIWSFCVRIVWTLSLRILGLDRGRG